MIIQDSLSDIIIMIIYCFIVCLIVGYSSIQDNKKERIIIADIYHVPIIQYSPYLTTTLRESHWCGRIRGMVVREGLDYYITCALRNLAMTLTVVLCYMCVRCIHCNIYLSIFRNSRV